MGKAAIVSRALDTLSTPFHIFKHTFPRMRSFLLLQLLVLKDALSAHVLQQT